MIKRDILLSKIDEAIELEKKIIPLLNKHVSSTLFFSGLPTDVRDSINRDLQAMVISKSRHIEMLGGIRDEVKKGAKDVY